MSRDQLQAGSLALVRTQNWEWLAPVENPRKNPRIQTISQNQKEIRNTAEL